MQAQVQVAYEGFVRFPQVVTRNTTSFEGENKRAIANPICITVFSLKSGHLRSLGDEVPWALSGCHSSKGSIVYTNKLFYATAKLH